MIRRFLEASLDEETAEAFVALVGSLNCGLSVYARTAQDVPGVLATCLLGLSMDEDGLGSALLDERVKQKDVEFLRSFRYDSLVSRYRSRKRLARIIRRLIAMEQLEIYSPQADGHDRRISNIREYLLCPSSRA